MLCLLGPTAGCPSDDVEGTGSTQTATESGPGSTSSVTGSTGAPSGTSSDAGSGTDTGGMADDAGATALLERLPGLWVGPVDSNTSVGDFATMNMDVRAADAKVLFSRVDLDPDNSLRFAFSFEEHDGNVELVYRNGGEFQGILRDTRTVLVEADVEQERFRFCALSAGCAYVDATFDFDGPDDLLLDVDVMGMMHIDWPARRAETRSVPDPFPSSPEPNADDAAFPPMPTLRATLSWNEPLEAPTDVWLILSTTDCGFTPGSCSPSRFLEVSAPTGATEAEILFEQIHPGEYKANAILDRNGNVGSLLFPDTGDTVSIPNQAVSIEATGESTASLALTLDV